MLLFTKAILAQTVAPSITPITTSFLLESEPFNCRFSIDSVSADVGSEVENGGVVSVEYSYDLSSVLEGVQVDLLPIYTVRSSDSESLFFDFVSFGGLLDSIDDLIILNSSDQQRSVSGKTRFTLTNEVTSASQINDIVVFATFSREGDDGETITLGSRGLPCENTISKEVNLTFLTEPTLTQDLQ